MLMFVAYLKDSLCRTCHRFPVGTELKMNNPCRRPSRDNLHYRDDKKYTGMLIDTMIIRTENLITHYVSISDTFFLYYVRISERNNIT